VQCSFDDGPSDHTVKARIIDKDGGFSEYTTSVHVRNVAPTASFSNDGPVDEGSPATVSVSNQDDPSSADTAAGFHYAYSCSNGDLSGATYAGSGSDASHQCSYDDGPSPHAVTARIIDKDGGFSEYTTEVVVRNVAPIADLANNGPVDEGSPATVSFSNQDDASSADTAAGFRYEYHCDGSAFAAAADYDGADTSASHQCTYPDGPSDHLVRARIIDKDGGATEYTTSVHVVNVAPRVSLTGPNTANEGESKTYTYTVRDPGEDDFTPAPGYPSCGANGTVVPGSETTNAAGGSFQCHFADGPKTTLVAIKVEDSDGAMSVADSEAVDIIEVTVANVAPSLAAPANQSASEGTGKTFELGSFSDDGVDDSPWTVDVDWGDGGSDSFTVSSQGALSHSHTYADNGTYTVKVKVTDKDGAPSPERSFEVSVANVAPNLTGAANQTANEGTSKSFALGSFSDDGADDGPWMVAVNWGDGSETFQVTTQGAISRSHTYDDNGTYTVKVKVTDKDDGASEEKSFQVTVDNVAPTASFSNNGPVDEGSSFTLSMTNGDDVSSADKAAKFEFAFDCGDGSGYGPWSSPAALADSRVCSTDDNGSRAVKAKIRDKDGGVREYSDAVTVKNVAPSATFNAPDEVNEGDNINVSLTSPSDPSSADTAAGFTYAFDCGSGYGAFAASNSASCPTTDDGTKTVKGKIRDKDGGEREYTKQVTVGNVAPQVTIVSPTFGQLFAKPANVPLTASFTDSGTGDTHTCSINWDDGTSSAGNVTEANGSGTCSKTYTYYTAGVYTIKVTVTDDEGAKGTAEVMIVVYDQSAGFVTGGGWIDVAAGSYRADPTLAGRANFGFTSKYKNGASTPTGETEFNFQVGNFKFHSANYQWLVVSGFKAQYKGTGEVNGVPGYDFRLTAYDGDLMSPKGPDKFRIKITKQGSGELVFDNRLGKGDDIDVADPQAISGGSIVIHKA
jgi:PKD repeat protein